MTFPKKGQRVLVWLDDRWEVANFRGDDSSYCWDLDTFGLKRDEIKIWAALPPRPGNA